MEFTMAFFVVTFLLVYILNVPHSLGGSKALANEYYEGEHSFFYVHLDMILVALYLVAAGYIIKRYDIQGTMKRILTIAAVSFCITSLFMVYFKNYGDPAAFFTRWFNAVGWKAGLYDVILVCAVYALKQYITKVSS